MILNLGASSLANTWVYPWIFQYFQTIQNVVCDGIPVQLGLRYKVYALEHRLSIVLAQWLQLNKCFQTLTEKLKADRQDCYQL